MDRSDLIPLLFERHAAFLSLTRDPFPGTPDRFWERQEELRVRHAAALGVDPRHSPSAVPISVLAVHERNGYTLKKILFETLPDVWATAHLYLPRNSTGPSPAVLCVHGHWPGAKNAEPVHARCVFLAMRGFVVLSLDAAGAGERAYQGITYHGRLLGYQPTPAGLTLAGIQVMENRRAVDLLQSLPEVNPSAVGVTGASGGGNQSFHLAILDPRIRAAVPVCFFGSYCGYLRGAHCACETIPDVLTYADEGNLAGLIAPRSLMIIAAKEDAGAAFQIEDARRQASAAAVSFNIAGVSREFEFVEFEGGHDYSQGMRERMVAFFERKLMGRDSGESILQPDLDLMDAVSLNVLENGEYPVSTHFIPELVAESAELRIREFENGRLSWSNPAARAETRRRFIAEVLGGFPTDSPLKSAPSPDGRSILLESEPGVWIDVESLQVVESPKRTVIIVGPIEGELSEGQAPDLSIKQLHPRGTGPTGWPAANTVDCRDYLLAQGSVVLGRPMMGQWVWDVLRTVEQIKAETPRTRITVAGVGEFGLTALLAAALEDRIDAVGAVDLLASYVHPGRFDDRWGLVHFIPGLLKFGDVPHFASAVSPRPVWIAGPRKGDGVELNEEERAAFLAAFAGDPASSRFARVLPSTPLAEILLPLSEQVLD